MGLCKNTYTPGRSPADSELEAQTLLAAWLQLGPMMSGSQAAQRWFLECGGVGLQEFWEIAQVGINRNLRVHVQVKNDCSGTSIDKATLLGKLQHETHQKKLEKGTDSVSLGHEVSNT